MTIKMNINRLPMRLVKCAIFLGAIGLMIEALFELNTFAKPFLAPPSIPGQSKIIEHFLLQHIVFPIIGFLLVFSPFHLRSLIKSKLATSFLVIAAVLVTIPESIVSGKDLFRPYPFTLHSSFLDAIQMVRFGRFEINLLQAQHLMFSHFCLMGSIVMLAFAGEDGLKYFAGPRTGYLLFQKRE
jgi:hypothetical protein